MYTSILILHVLAATIWTGGHIILSTLILPKALKHRDENILITYEHGYEKIDMPALLIQVLSGVWLAYQLQPDIRQWFTFNDFVSTSIGLKLGLLALTAAFALDAKFRVIPTLRPETLNDMAWHIIPVTVLSVLFVIVGVSLNAGGF